MTYHKKIEHRFPYRRTRKKTSSSLPYEIDMRPYTLKKRFHTKPVSKGRTFEIPYRSAELKKVQQLTTYTFLSSAGRCRTSKVLSLHTSFV